MLGPNCRSVAVVLLAALIYSVRTSAEGIVEGGVLGDGGATSDANVLDALPPPQDIGANSDSGGMSDASRPPLDASRLPDASRAPDASGSVTDASEPTSDGGEQGGDSGAYTDTGVAPDGSSLFDAASAVSLAGSGGCSVAGDSSAHGPIVLFGILVIVIAARRLRLGSERDRTYFLLKSASKTGLSPESAVRCI